MSAQRERTDHPNLVALDWEETARAEPTHHARRIYRTAPLNTAVNRACWDCGWRTDERRARCRCGEPLWLVGDPLTSDDPSAPTLPDAVETMWDVAGLLGLDHVAPETGLAAEVGGTPLVRTPALDALGGVEGSDDTPTSGPRIHVKYEGANPTGSFKDRGTAFGLTAALADGVAEVGTVSHGNMAVSVAAHAAAADLPCTVLVPADIADERLAAIGQFGPRIVRVDGDYGALYERSLDIGRETGVRFLNSDVPTRVAGQATTALEAIAQLAPETPDAIVCPVSSGGHAGGLWQAVRALVAGGSLEAAPRLYFVQAAACAPIAAAFARGDESVARVEGGETIAYSIANADPPSGVRTLAAARDTGGSVLAVDDDEIRAARRRFARDAGLTVEPASATTLAAAERLAVADELGPDDDVVLVATGRGFGGGSAGRVETVERELAAVGDLFPR
jgi:threonine synthase